MCTGGAYFGLTTRSQLCATEKLWSPAFLLPLTRGLHCVIYTLIGWLSRLTGAPCRAWQCCPSESLEPVFRARKENSLCASCCEFSRETELDKRSLTPGTAWYSSFLRHKKNNNHAPDNFQISCFLSEESRLRLRGRERGEALGRYCTNSYPKETFS